MHKYKVGEKVRIRSDIKNRKYDDCLATKGMVKHAGEVVTIGSYVANHFTVQENLVSCKHYFFVV